MSPKKVATLVVGLAPFLADWIYRVWLHPRPFWIHYFDPEAIYFYGGTRILAGRSPVNVDNPGLPVYFISSAIELITGASPFDFPAFRTIAYVVTLLLGVFAAIVLMRAMPESCPPSLAVVTLWTFFITPQALERGLVWGPESLYFVAGALTIVAVHRMLTKRGTPLVAGIALGLCISIKFLFIAWVPALAIAILIAGEAVGKRLAQSALGVLAGFSLASCIVIDRLPDMFRWLTRLATHSGEYGTGQKAAPDLRQVVANLVLIVSTSRIWILWVLIAAVMAFLSIRGQSRARASVLVFASLAFLGGYGVALRSTDFHYLIPTGLAVVLMFIVAGETPVVGRYSAIALLCMGAIFCAKTVRDDLRLHDARIEQGTRARQEIDAALRKLMPPDAVVIYGWRAPQPSFALRIMTRDPSHLAAISARFPREGHCDWTGNLFLPTGAKKWDAMVIASARVAGHPEFGVIRARAGSFVILTPPAVPK